MRDLSERAYVADFAVGAIWIVDRLVPVAVANPTSCSFGGPGLTTLFVTTANQGLDARQRREQELAGAVFAFEPGVRGVTEPAFGG